MSPYLQKMIDDEVANTNERLKTCDLKGWKIKHGFQDFARKVLDADFEIAPVQAQQILDLMDLLGGHQQIMDSDRSWMLGTLLRKLRGREADQAQVFNRVLTDSVNLSIARIEEKEQNPVVGGRKLFEFFAYHAKALSDDTFKLVFDHSRILTRFCGDDDSRHNLLFDCSNEFFQQLHPSNHALMHLIALYVDDYENLIDWNGYTKPGYKTDRLHDLMGFLQRAHGLGVKVQMHAADVLLISGFAKNLMAIEQPAGPVKRDALIETVKALLEMVTPDEGLQALSANLFKYPVRPKVVFKTKQTWLVGQFCPDFHKDMAKSFSDLASTSGAEVIKPQINAFIGHVFLSAAQAYKPMESNRQFNGAWFLREVAGLCRETLVGGNPLKGLKKEERLAVLEAVTDIELKRQLLNKYKAEKGQVLMHDLGL